MFERNVTKDLEQWEAKKNRKPLILRGSRQVGKTTLVESFSENFENYLYLNFEKNPSAIALFEKEQEIDDLLSEIFLFCNKEKQSGKTLLFIDEIQNSRTAITKLRYFYEAKIPDLYVIAAGSLLETMLNKKISFPVGRVEYLAVRPCVFNEFLRAIGETQLEKALINTRIPAALHDKTMNLFNTFTLTGGMPEVVADYAENKDFVGLNKIYESLLTSYRDDVEKYARNETMTQVIRYILQAGWKFAAERITLGAFAGSSYKAREMGEAFRTLEKIFVLELCYPTTDCLIPITKNLKRSPKLLWLDCGLVNYAANVQKEVFGAKDILDAWRGKIAEQVVAQELLAIDNRVSAQRNFWVRDKNTSQAEVDFVLQYDGKIIPIEVKSGHNAKLKSLHLFMEEAPHNIAVRVWSQPFSIDEVTTQNGKTFKLINLPFYYVGRIEEFLKLEGDKEAQNEKRRAS
ncbi:MAG: AAA family ATPase [Candidatus Symbiothrix sp.]|jgi:predicted AAA+ superfamily ATPase|nr:AAA family ATPase [Candidatus Symbiothrix sp.]